MKQYLVTSLAVLMTYSHVTLADSFTDALKNGKASADLRLRYETVEQSNTLDDAKSLTLRTRLGYTTGTYKGFSALIEMEDVRVVGGIDDYSVGPTGFKPGVYSVIADPEVTEVDQGFIQYKGDSTTIKLGRQVVALDNQRFVGHVGWRQDRQTFDGINIKLVPMQDLSMNLVYITKRNRLFAEAADLDAKDTLLNIGYKTPFGKISGYAYLLEIDNNTDNALDTYGLRLTGNRMSGSAKFLYTVEYASQESESGATKFDADYLFLEGGSVINGITFKLGYEVLGSDNASYGFATPLATLHKFNGWTDQFLATPSQGLVDTYVSFSTKLFDGKVIAAYHNFEADDATATVDDLGNEINFAYIKKFNKIYNGGIKYATYSAGDSAAGKVDTDKLWLWVGLKF